MKRRGFTLVELLIIIAVIGVLASMMMISSGDTVASAKASNIISNMRNMKAADLSLYIDKMDKWAVTGHKADSAKSITELKPTAPTIAEVMKYMSTSEIDGAQEEGEYNIVCADASTEDDTDYSSYADRDWFISYTFPKAGTTGSASANKIKERLADRAKSIGLSGTKDGKAPKATNGKYPAFKYEEDDDDNNHTVVFLKVR